MLHKIMTDLCRQLCARSLQLALALLKRLLLSLEDRRVVHAGCLCCIQLFALLFNLRRLTNQLTYPFVEVVPTVCSG